MNRLVPVISICCLLLAASAALGGPNLLDNSSFETQGSSATEAENWEYNNPDTHGGKWGNATREGWRANSGSWEGTVRGNWSGQDFGGWWQEASATAGIEYEVSAWFWADNSPGNVWSDPTIEQVLKIEFYSASYGSPLLTVTTNFFDIVEVWQQKSISAVAPAGTAWARAVIAASGTGPQGALQFDDVELKTIAAADARSQDFNSWTSTTYQTDGCYTLDDWTLCTGRIVSAEARTGLAADLGNPGTVSNQGHYIQSPFFEDGVGTISFWYRHKDGSVPTVDYVVQTSTNGTNWTTQAKLNNISDTNYTQFSTFLYEPAARYVRILHTNGQNRLVIDDIAVAKPSIIIRFQEFDSWAAISNIYACTNVSEWVVCSGQVHMGKAYSGKSVQLKGTPTSNNYIRTPKFSNGVGTVSFLYRHSDGGSPVSFALQTSPDATNWTTRAMRTNIVSTQYRYFAKYLYLTNGLYVRLLHAEGTSDLHIDNVNIGLPVVSRTQDFDTWPTAGTYSNSTHQGWTVFDGRVNDDKPFGDFGQSAHMDGSQSPATGQYIRTPYLPVGVGSISFQYARDTLTKVSDVRYDVELSADGTNWVKFDELNIPQSDTNYQHYVKYLYETNYHYVRLWHAKIGDRVFFDDVEIDVPSPPASLTMVGWNEPDAPSSNQTVDLYATVSPQNGASDVTVTSYYRIGTSGAFTAIGMSITSAVTYVTTNPIPLQPAGSIVQYYMAASFSGAGSETNSPVYWPDGAPTTNAEYRVPRGAPGKVWINELNYINSFFGGDDTNEFVELAGPAGWDLTGWKVQFMVRRTTVDMFNVYAEYEMPAETIISNDVGGFGFFVLGDIDVPPSDIVFTHTNDIDSTQIVDAFDPVKGGIRVVNEAGGIEQSISYNGSISGFDALPLSESAFFFPDPVGLQLTGPGTNYDDFTWTRTNMTPGDINIDQFILGCPPNMTMACTSDVPAVDTNAVSAATDCTGGVVYVSHKGDSDNGGSGCAGDPLVITRTYEITDDCGQTSECTQVFTILDNEAPVITFCPADVEVESTNDVPAVDTNAVTATDCGGVMITHVSDVDDGGSGEFGDPKTITRTYRATDTCLNTTDCVQTITVEALEDIEIYVYRIEIETNVIIYSTYREGWDTVPFFTTNILDTSSWAEVGSYMITTNNGTNCIWFDLPVVSTGANAFFRVDVQTNAP